MFAAVVKIKSHGKENQKHEVYCLWVMLEKDGANEDRADTERQKQEAKGKAEMRSIVGNITCL